MSSIFDQGKASSTLNPSRRVSAFAGSVFYLRYRKRRAQDETRVLGRIVDLQPAQDGESIGLRLLYKSVEQENGKFVTREEESLTDLTVGPFERVVQTPVGVQQDKDSEPYIVESTANTWGLYGEHQGEKREAVIRLYREQ